MQPWGLKLVGDAQPTSAGALRPIERRFGLTLPTAYVQLVTTWGFGSLCGWIPLLDPTQHEGWDFHRRFVTGDGRKFRKQWGQWKGIDDETFAHLVTWADLDGFKLSWDVTTPLSNGEYPIWAWDRDGQVMRRAAHSLQELVEGFLLGGDLDRYAPPSQGGAGGCARAT